MNRSKTNRWLCVFGTVISVMIAYSISIQNEGHDATNMELPIGASMGPDLMTRNGEQSFSQLQQLIEGTIETDAWRLTGSSSMKPHRTIESVLTNGEGCKTFTYDGDGNLLPDVERHYDSTELTNNSLPIPGEAIRRRKGVVDLISRTALAAVAYPRNGANTDRLIVASASSPKSTARKIWREIAEQIRQSRCPSANYYKVVLVYYPFK